MDKHRLGMDKYAKKNVAILKFINQLVFTFEISIGTKLKLTS